MNINEYIIKFGFAGLQNLNIAVLGLKKLDLAGMGVSKTFEKDLVRAANQAGLKVNDLSDVIGVKMVSSIKKNGEILQQWRAKIRDAEGDWKNLDFTMSKVGRSSIFKLSPNSTKISDINANSINKAVPQATPGFFQRLNPFGEEDKIDVAGLVKRAAVTIPVWFALRNAMQLTFAVIPEGIQRIRDLNDAVSEMKVLTDGADNITNFSLIAEDRLNKLSRETGKSIEELKKLYTGFSSTGLDAGTSFAGMEITAKGSIATMSDQTQLAKILAGVINNLGDTMEIGSTKAEKIEYAMALINVIFKENAGSVDEFAEALKNSVGEASLAGVTFKDLMINLGTLHTAMRASAMAGNAVRISYSQLTSHRKDIEKFLNRQVRDSELENYSLLLVEIIERLRTMQSSGLIREMTTEIDNMFGEKARTNIVSLLGNYEKFAKNRASVNKITTLSDVREINAKPYNERMETLNKQLDRAKQNFQELARVIIQGVVGTDESKMVGFMKDFNIQLDNAIIGAKGLAEAMQVIARTLEEVNKYNVVGGFFGGLFEGVNKNNVDISKSIFDPKMLKGFDFRNPASWSKQIGRVISPFNILNALGIMRENRENNTILNSSPVDLGVLPIGKPRSFAISQTTLTQGQSIRAKEITYDKLKQYGLDDLQIQRVKIGLLASQEEKMDALLKLQESMNAEAQAYVSKVQDSMKDSILRNFRGEGNSILTDFGNNFKSMLQENVAGNLSKLIMSSGVGAVMANAFGVIDEQTRKITDPIIKAHDDGGKKVHDWIVNAFNEIMGKTSTGAGNAYSGANATMSSGANLGIWSAPFLNRRTYGGQINKPLKFSYGNQQNAYGDYIKNYKAPSSGYTLGQYGYGAMAISSSALIASSGAQQMSGGGMKNITGGLGTIASGIGAGAIGLGMAGFSTFAAGGALAALGPVGLILGATLMIASLFMKGAKQSSTQSQTSETKVGSKIDISNKKLELINRNLIALRNTMETYALATSSYFSEKNGTIDAEFALSGRRAF